MSWAGSVDTGGRNGYGGGADRGSGGIGPSRTHTSIPGARARGAPPDADIGKNINTGTMANPSLTGQAQRGFAGDVATVGPGRGYGPGHTAGLGGFAEQASRAVSAFSRTADPRAKAAQPRTSRIANLANSVNTISGPRNTEYGNSFYSGPGAIGNASQAASMSRAQHTAAMEQAGVPGAVQAGAQPGTMATIAGGLLGIAGLGPLGMVGNTAMAARQASGRLGAINDRFGTSLDDSFSNSLGQQALGSIAGFAGGQAGGMTGATAGGRAFGPAGAVVGGLLGSRMGSQAGRGMAFGGLSPGEAPSPNDVGDARMAEARPTRMQPPVARQATIQPPQSGVGTFADYGSYARQFFA